MVVKGCILELNPWFVVPNVDWAGIAFGMEGK
jgi:hypothetical protein